jgi:catechol 2,3-dioxygenase-like lactoylglutathione lyase family enzyme
MRRRLLQFVASIALVTLARPAAAQLAFMNDSGVAFGHVHLTVRDIEVHKKIWVEHFGGVLVQKGPLTAIKLPGMLVALRQGEPTGGSQGTVMDHFGFKVRNTAAFADAWRAAGFEVQSQFTGTEGFPNAYLMAPDGVRIELQQDETLPVKASAYHLHFFSPDRLALRDWYVQTFNAVPRFRGDHEAADVPGMNLSFGDAAAPRPGTRGRAMDHIGFEVRNLEAFVQKLKGRGITFDVDYRDVPSIGLKIAYLTDPRGTYIELTEGYAAY